MILWGPKMAEYCIACEELKNDDEICRDGMCRSCWKFVSNPQRTPRGQRAVNIKYSFGLKYRDYSSMYAHQDGKCMICRSPLAKYKGHGDSPTACVDHDHETGQVRGLLCRKCNTGIGCFNDSPDLMDSAIEYLLKFQDD